MGFSCLSSKLRCWAVTKMYAVLKSAREKLAIVKEIKMGTDQEPSICGIWEKNLNGKKISQPKCT